MELTQWRPKRPLSPQVLKGNQLLRFVVPFYSITRQLSFAPLVALFGWTTLETETATGDMVDRFLIYNARARRLRRENVEAAMKEIFGDGQAALDMADRIEDIYKGVELIKNFAYGNSPFVEYIYVGLLIEGAHYAKCKIERGKDYGAIRVIVRPLSSVLFVSYIVPINIYDLLNYYYKRYKTAGRPNVQFASQEVVSRVAKGNMDIDTALHYIIVSTTGVRTYAFKTFVVFFDREKIGVFCDAKRLIHAPPLAKTTKIVVFQSGDTGIIAFFLDDTVENIVREIKLINNEMLNKLTMQDEDELFLIQQKASLAWYGMYTGTGEEEEALTDLLLGSGGEREESITIPVEQPATTKPRTERMAEVEKKIEKTEETGVDEEGEERRQHVKKRSKMEEIGGEEL